MPERAEGFWWVRRLGQGYDGRWGPGLVAAQGGHRPGLYLCLWWDGHVAVDDPSIEWGPYLGKSPADAADDTPAMGPEMGEPGTLSGWRYRPKDWDE